jgi:hypothetical protein
VRTLPKPYPAGPLGPNPANTPGVGDQTNEPHHEAVHDVSRTHQLIGLRNALGVARKQGDTARAEQLAAEMAALEQQS